MVLINITSTIFYRYSLVFLLGTIIVLMICLINFLQQSQQ